MVSPNSKIDMLQSIFEFGETIVREVMLPRTEMVACSNTAPISDVIRTIVESGHSRIPLYEDSPDKIVGIVYAKDLLRFWGQDDSQLLPEKVMRPVFFIPETKKLEDLLDEFRARRVHIAIVIDEYGGTSGLITIEDLLEEIVGDIQDEYDLEEDEVSPQADGSTLVSGRLNIEEFEELFTVHIPHEHFDTVGGYVVDRFGHVPVQGEQFVEGPLVLTVMDSDQRVVRQVRVERTPVTNGDAV
jgi:magnesium and cobalt transporter